MYDYHTHTDFSADSRTPISEMVRTAINAGVTEIAITDHFDPDYPLSDWPSTLDFEGYHRQMEQASASYKGQIRVIKGIEIGIQHGETLETCRQTAAAYDYDFILGSFHCAEGFELSCGDFFENRSQEEATRAFYRYNLACLKEYDEFDVLGHINVVDRYGAYIPSADSYMDELTAVLELLIAKGKGIEINTSSFRYGMGDRTTPALEMLARYKELGGEIITVGSDAHAPKHVGYALDWGYETLRKLGFRYVTLFHGRQPEFVKL